MPWTMRSNLRSSFVLARRSQANARLRSAGMNGRYPQTGDNREPARFNDGRIGNTRANGGPESEGLEKVGEKRNEEKQPGGA